MKNEIVIPQFDLEKIEITRNVRQFIAGTKLQNALKLSHNNAPYKNFILLKRAGSITIAKKRSLRGPSTLTWELRTGDCKITLEDKKKIGNVTYYISSESLRDAESE